MKAVAVFFAALAVAAAIGDDLVQRSDIRDASGQITHSYTTQQGTHVSERGILKRTPDGKDNVLTVSGTYRYFTPDAVYHKVEYKADENGYQVVSDDVPKPVVAGPPTF